jgi:peptide/nickel transport system substrate-binding protein
MTNPRVVAALFLVLLLLFACTDRLQSDSIRMGLSVAPLNLDPRYATDAASSRINRLLYQRLVEFDDQGKPVPGIAEWVVLDPKHYRFTLREPNARFSDGSKLSSADVAETYRFILNPVNASPHRSALELIEGVEVVDHLRVDFFLKRADPLFPAYLALEILPARAIGSNHSFASDPLGSGGFRFAGRPEPGRIRLERRRDGQLFELIEVKNPTVRVLKLLRGEIHLLQNDLSPELVGYLKRQEEIHVDQRPGSNFSYLGFNLQDAKTSDRRVRLAIAHAIDREGMVGQLMNRGARLAESLFPPEHWVGNPELEALRYDPERARQLLAEAGFKREQPLQLVYKTSSDPFRIRLATFLQSQLKEVGIEVDLRSYDWGTFFGDIKTGRFQLYSLTWVGLRTPDSFHYIFASDSVPPKGANRGRYSNPKLDELLRQAQQQDDTTEMAIFYRQIQQILHDDLPYVPLWYEEQMAASRPEISGYRLQADGNYDGLESVELVLPSHPED